jgi:hypothetical protein
MIARGFQAKTNTVPGLRDVLMFDFSPHRGKEPPDTHPGVVMSELPFNLNPAIDERIFHHEGTKARRNPSDRDSSDWCLPITHLMKPCLFPTLRVFVSKNRFYCRIKVQSTRPLPRGSDHALVARQQAGGRDFNDAKNWL